MGKALILKELREIAWIGGLTALILAYLVVYATGYDLLFMQETPVDHIPFVNDDLFNETSFLLLAGACAVAIGFRQSVWESFRGTYLFLLHRPISHTRLFLIKLSVGLGLQMAVTGLAIVAYGIWASIPGTHPSPFDWSMTQQEWMMWLSMSTFYFAAFLCGVRDARWYATRLLPLVAAALIVVIGIEFGFYWPIRVGMVLLADLLYLFAILYVVHNRDYP